MPAHQKNSHHFIHPIHDMCLSSIFLFQSSDVTANSNYSNDLFRALWGDKLLSDFRNIEWMKTTMRYRFTLHYIRDNLGFKFRSGEFHRFFTAQVMLTALNQLWEVFQGDYTSHGSSGSLIRKTSSCSERHQPMATSGDRKAEQPASSGQEGARNRQDSSANRSTPRASTTCGLNRRSRTENTEEENDQFQDSMLLPFTGIERQILEHHRKHQTFGVWSEILIRGPTPESGLWLIHKAKKPKRLMCMISSDC